MTHDRGSSIIGLLASSLISKELSGRQRSCRLKRASVIMYTFWKRARVINNVHDSATKFRTAKKTLNRARVSIYAHVRTRLCLQTFLAEVHSRIRRLCQYAGSCFRRTLL
jgi:hypothetical protein